MKGRFGLENLVHESASNGSRCFVIKTDVRSLLHHIQSKTQSAEHLDTTLWGSHENQFT